MMMTYSRSRLPIARRTPDAVCSGLESGQADANSAILLIMQDLLLKFEGKAASLEIFESVTLDLYAHV